MDAVLIALAAIGWLSGGALVVLTGYSLALFALGRGPTEPEAAGEGTPEVTVVVSAYGRSEALVKTLHRAGEIQYPALRLLLALGTEPAPSAAELPGPFDVITSGPLSGKSQTLNRVASLVKSDYMLMLDEDSMVDPDCLQVMLPRAGGRGVWAVVGEPFASNPDSRVVPRTLGLESEAWSVIARARDRLGLFLPATGFFALVRRESLPTEGKVWDEDALAEDTDLSVRQEARGLRTRLSRARVGIEAPSTLGALAKQRLRWYKGMFDALWKNRALVVRLPPLKLLDVTLTLLSPLAPAGFVVLLLLSPLWPTLLGPFLLGVAALYLLSSWASSSTLKSGRGAVLLFSVPYAVIQGGVSLAALLAFLAHVDVKWHRTPKAGDRPAERKDGSATQASEPRPASSP